MAQKEVSSGNRGWSGGAAFDWRLERWAGVQPANRKAWRWEKQAT